MTRLHTKNAESISGVQYSCESRPSLTRRECLHHYPVRSPVQEVEKDWKSAERPVSITNFRVFSRIFAVFLPKYCREII